MWFRSICTCISHQLGLFNLKKKKKKDFTVFGIWGNTVTLYSARTKTKYFCTVICIRSMTVSQGRCHRPAEPLYSVVSFDLVVEVV